MPWRDAKSSNRIPDMRVERPQPKPANFCASSVSVTRLSNALVQSSCELSRGRASTTPTAA